MMTKPRWIRKSFLLILVLALALTGSGCGQKKASSSASSEAEEKDLLLSTFRKVEAPSLPSVSAVQKDVSRTELPAKWDSRLAGRCPQPPDQKDLGTCWAFTALGAIEAKRLPAIVQPLSVDHLTAYNGYRLTPAQGGTSLMALAYLAGWKGPVSEEEDPYDDGMTNPDAKPVLHLRQARYLSNDRDAVKKAVLGDGAVESEMYADPSFLAGDAGSVFYDPDTFSYYYQGSETANHEILIVGWDDSFAADNFAIKAPDDGAFICQNSWGTDFADGGYFYISYYDSCILKRPLCFDRLDPIGTYDQIYQQDLLGHTANAGFGGPEAWGTCLYTAQSDQTLKAVSFYTTGRDTSFEIYTAEEPDSSFSKRIMQAEGTRTYEGYYTVELARPVTLQKGERFAILLKVDCPGSFKPLAVETDVEEAVSQRQMGTSFMSNDGKTWTDTVEQLNCSLCLKAFCLDSSSD